MILADTSVWIDHLRWPNSTLADALAADEIVIHPFVIGELACGNLHNRRELLALWANLPFVPSATDEEVLRFIDRQKLMGIGLGYVDVHLLASTALAGTAKLWTKDRQLATAAAKLNLGHDG
jgi:predicted nucleic acid-binding protein